MPHIPSHFSDVLREHFNRRAERNTSYSLRAFARDLEIPASVLSEIFSKKAGISLKKAGIIAEKLNLDEGDRKFFCKLVEAGCARSKEERERAESELWSFDSSYTHISDDYYRIVSDWYHFALVEMVRIKGFKNSPLWIAKRLGITSDEAKAAIGRLTKIGLLEVVDGELRQTYDFLFSPTGTPSDAARKFHKQVLANAIAAIDVQRVEERYYTSGFIRIRDADIPKASAKIERFWKKLVKELESGEGHDNVYALSTQLFRAITPSTDS